MNGFNGFLVYCLGEWVKQLLQSKERRREEKGGMGMVGKGDGIYEKETLVLGEGPHSRQKKERTN